MKILLNCYACSPYKGSEPGMGWNFVRCLSKKHELHIITESKFQPDLEKYFSEHPEERNAYHFYFIRKERHKKLRKIWPPSYYWYYRKWQRKALQLAMELDEKENFDLIHQLNMIGYREPGYLWKIDKPVVWGPIGGFNITPWRFLPSMGLKGMVFYGFRNLINMWQMRYSHRIREASRQCSYIISATQDSYDVVTKLWKRESIIIPEVGLMNADENLSVATREGKLRICWSGQHTPGKSLNLLLKALTKCESKNSIELHVLGQGEQTEKWKALAEKLQLSDITWHGWVERAESVKVMKNCHLFVITSMADATSSVLLEAMSIGLPVIAPDLFGFSNVITSECGIKIATESKDAFIEGLADVIESIVKDEPWRTWLAEGAQARARQFTWDDKAKKISDIYKKTKK